MPKIVLPLTNAKIQAAKPSEKMYKLADGQGLALWVYPSGNKSWKFTYTLNDKKYTKTLGSYPQFSLFDARAWREEMRDKLKNGELEQEAQTIKKEKERDNFVIDTLFDIWAERWKETVSEKYGKQVHKAILDNAMPLLSGKDVREITTYDIVRSLRPMEKRGVLEYLRRTKYGLSMFFDDLVGQGIIPFNPVSAIGKKVFKPHQSKHFDALKPEQLPDLIKFLETGNIEFFTRLSIYALLFTMTRVSECVGMKWSEIDEENDVWRIPADRMKKRREHVVPLSKGMKWVLEQAREANIHHVYVFEGRDFKSHLHQETPRIALRRSGLNTTAHGLRSLARTYLGEHTKFSHDALELLLAHLIGDKTERAYNRVQLLDERREALEWWSNEILTLKEQFQQKED